MNDSGDPVAIAIEILEGYRRDEIEIPQTYANIFNERLAHFVTYAQALELTIERLIHRTWDIDRADDLDDFVNGELIGPISGQALDDDDLEWLYTLSLNRTQIVQIHEVVDGFLKRGGIEPNEEGRVTKQ